MEIIPNVHLIPNITANPYLIIEPVGLTLIDAGMPGSHKKILRYLAGLGYAPKGLKRILITHSDLDHVGGLASLKAATGALVFASPIEAQAIAERHPSRPLNPRSRMVKLLMQMAAGLFKPASTHVDGILAEGQGGTGKPGQAHQTEQPKLPHRGTSATSETTGPGFDNEAHGADWL